MNNISHVRSGSGQDFSGRLATAGFIGLTLLILLAMIPAVSFAGVTATTDELYEIPEPDDWEAGVNFISGITLLGNTVTVTDGGDPLSSGNRLTFNSADIRGMSVAAGGSLTGTVNDNILTVTGAAGSDSGNEAQWAVGGFAQGIPTADLFVNDNHVVVNTPNFVVQKYIIGGLAVPGNAPPAYPRTTRVVGNTVTFEASANMTTNIENIFGGAVMGGGLFDAQGTVSENEVIIEDGSGVRAGSIAGGKVDGMLDYTHQANISVTGNKVTAFNASLVAFVSIYGGIVESGSATEQGYSISVSSNEVTLDLTNADLQDVAGGYGVTIQGGLFQSNTVTISGSTTRIWGQVVGGGNSDVAGNADNTARSNEVKINVGEVQRSVFGGFVTTGTVDANKVYLNGGRFYWDVVAGSVKSGNGTATGNFVAVNTEDAAVSVGWNTKGGVYGAVIDYGNASGNYVDVKVDGTHSFTVAGPASGYGIGGAWLKGTGGVSTAVDNWTNINIIDGTLTNDNGNIFGAQVAGDGSVDLSKVTVRVGAGNSLANANGHIFAALLQGDGNITDSVANITVSGPSSSLTANDIFAAKREGISSSGNIDKAMVVLNVDGGTVVLGAELHGGSNEGSGNVTGSGVTVIVGSTSGSSVTLSNDGIVGASVYDGSASDNYVNLDVSGVLTFGSWAGISGASLGSNSSGDAVNNQVNIEMGGTSSSVTGISSISGGFTDGSGSAIGNKLFVSCKDPALCGTVSATGLSGGRANSGDATDNLLYISGAAATAGDVSAGYSYSGNAENNTAYLTGSSNVTGNVTGGSSDTGNAANNYLILENFKDDSTGTSAYYGGYTGSSTSGTAIGNTVAVRGESTLRKPVYGGYAVGGTGDVTGNTVYIGGKLNLANSSVSLAGGSSQYGSGDHFSGNTLTLDYIDYNPLSNNFKDISGFDTINANVTSEYAKDALDTGTGRALIPAEGLIDLGNGSGRNTTINAHITGPEVLSVGSRIKVFEAVSVDWNNIDFNLTRNLMGYDCTGSAGQCEITARFPLDEAKVFSELPLADISFVNRGADFVTSQAIPAAIASVSGTAGAATFATVGYGWSRTETGSHIDVKGVSGDVGIAFGTETSAGPFTAGAFIEFGDGSFDSYNEFAGIPTVHGEGDVSYIGGGVFARLDLGQADSSRPYLEASARFGKTDADFETRDFQALGKEMKYDMDAKYWGFHAGAGYIID
ncbi:MAG: hypothetical protein LBT40_16455, partial [Deltaproteobacteria bacterium]|nr:hypothetical protein [Deltaproteobacteria bacterium]